jgi:BirA family biotin operon repressor/biotin-[acetyl-CoA-carboxylase] ligase
MSSSTLGEPFIILNEIESTNNYAMAQAGEGRLKEGTVWFAWKQTGGRGQRGKKWLSRPGESISLSIVLQPVIHPAHQFLLNATVALGVYDLIKAYAGSGTKIKWSNDIYWNDKKAGGILIENVIRGSRWSYAIAGIGLNINQETFSENLVNPVSLYQINGKKYDVLALAKELCRSIDARYKKLTPGNFSAILREYTSNLYLLDTPALYQKGDSVFEGTIYGVEPDGHLLIQKRDELLKISFGEITFLHSDLKHNR